MAILVIEEGAPNGTDLVMSACRFHGAAGKCSDCDPCRSEHPSRPGVFCVRFRGHPETSSETCVSEEGLAWNRSGAPLDKCVDDEEYRSSGKLGLRTRASEDGVYIHAMESRMLGVEQVRAMADALLRAATHAKKRGAPAVLMETS